MIPGNIRKNDAFNDWKSCRRDKRLEGSNPSLSAIYCYIKKFRSRWRNFFAFCRMIPATLTHFGIAGKITARPYSRVDGKVGPRYDVCRVLRNGES